MKHLIKFFVIALLTVLITPSYIFATEMNSNENVVITSDTVIEGDYFTAGDTVTFSGTVNGDLYVAGGNITIEGTVNGDILAAGGNITILGSIEQDVRVVGGNIIVSGIIGRNITAVGGSIQLTDSAEIQGSVVAAGGSIQLFATVPGNVTVAGGDVELGSEVTGDVFAAVGNMRMTPNSNIGGDLTYYSEESLQVPQGATISGQVMKKEYPQRPTLDAEQKENIKQAGQAARFGSKIINIISAFIVGALILKLFPKYTNHITDRISTRTGTSIGFGLVFLIATPITAFILLITIIGIPLAMVLLFAFFFSIFLAKIFISLVIGTKVLQYFKKEYNHYLVLFIGLVLYLILTSIPLIGWFVTFISVLTGVGAIFLAKKDYYEEVKAKKLA